MDGVVLGAVIAAGSGLVGAVVAEVRQARQDRRDDAKRVAQWNRDDAVRLRDRRQAAYEDLARVSHEAISYVANVKVRPMEDEDVIGKALGGAIAGQDALVAALTRVRLCALAETEAAATLLVSRTMDLVEATVAEEDVDAALATHSAALNKFLFAARAELGVPTQRLPEHLTSR